MLKRMGARMASIFMILSLLLPYGNVSPAQAETTANPDDEIIYIDSGGRIRIIDPNVAPGTQEIIWQSPEGGWFDFATGDFNGDGDAEIVAIGNGKWTIFDPVVNANSGINPDGYYNLVPWVRLAEYPLPGDVNLQRVAAGNLDQGIPGSEVILGYPVSEAGNINYRLTVFKRNDAQGRSWQQHVTAPFGVSWKFIEVGNINGVGSDDLVRLRDADLSAVEAVQIDNNWQNIFSRDRTGFTYTSAAIGRLYGGATGEVALTRTFGGTTEAASVIVYRFANNSWAVDPIDELRNFPHPYYVFFADINGSGDDELFWIRDNQGNGVRMVMVNRGGDQLPAVELPLDADNGFRVGVGGDVDGDGDDDVILMRNSAIRNYYDLRSGNTQFISYDNLSTNGRSLATANVDGNGFVAGNRFSVDVSAISVSLDAGTLSDAIRTVQLTSIGTSANVPFTVEKERGSTWFTVSTSSSTTPASIFVTGFNATQLKPGTYTDRLVIRSTANMLNQPFYVPVTLTVTQVSFEISRTNIGFAFPTQNPTAQQQSVAVSSLFPGLTYSAALIPAPAFKAAVEALGQTPRSGYRSEEGDIVLSNEDGEEYRIQIEEEASVSAAAVTWPSVPWATVQSTGATMPDTITITASADQMTQQTEHAILLIVADERAGVYPNNIKVVNVVAIRNAISLHLPIIGR